MDEEITSLQEASAPPCEDLPMMSIHDFKIKTDLSAWKNMTVRGKRTLKVLLHRMFQQGISRNITVVAENRHFSCHFIVLRAVSDYFRKLEFSHVVYLPKEKVTARAFICIYTWIFTGTTSLHGNVLIELFRAAQFLGIDGLLRLCWSCFENQTNCEGQAILLLEEAKTSTQLDKGILFARIHKYFLTYVASKEFQELNETEACFLLRSNSIGVNTEMEVLMAGLVWLSYNWTKRKDSLSKVLACMDFEQMPFLFLASFRKRHDSFIFEHISNSNCIDEVLQKIMSKEHKTAIFNRFKRYWIYDPLCKYHHSWDCNTSVYLTYDNFLDYLEQLQECDAKHIYCLKDSPSLTINCCPDNAADIENTFYY